MTTTSLCRIVYGDALDELAYVLDDMGACVFGPDADRCLAPQLQHPGAHRLCLKHRLDAILILGPMPDDLSSKEIAIAPLVERLGWDCIEALTTGRFTPGAITRLRRWGCITAKGRVLPLGRLIQSQFERGVL